MTIEESKIMWELEKQNTNFDFLTKEMKKLYNQIDKLISGGIITYEDFANDVLDELTNNIVDNGKMNINPDRAEQVKTVCLNLLKKYEEYTKVEPKERNLGVPVDNTEVLE